MARRCQLRRVSERVPPVPPMLERLPLCARVLPRACARGENRAMAVQAVQAPNSGNDTERHGAISRGASP